MESATLSRPRPVRAASLRSHARRARAWPWLGLAVVCVAAAVGFLAFPTFPNYDSYYSLLWGRELLDGRLPVYEAYRAPTPHPLATAVGALIAPVGHGAERLWIALCVLSFVALVAGVYRLASLAFTPLVGATAAVLLCTRFDFAFYAARGYLDIAYMAFVVWAAVVEARAPRRHPGRVLVLLAAAGLLRPEAWLMAALYWLWAAWRATWADRLGLAALAAIGPVVWASSDLLVTGDLLYSLTYTSAFAEELGRAKGAAGIPAATWEYLVKLDKTPVVAGGLAGLLLAVALVPRRVGVPLVLLAVGIGTFALVGVAGFSVIDRYLLISALMLMIFCAIALAGWTMLEPGRVRTAWMTVAGLVIAFGIVWTAIHVNLERLTTELRFRGNAHVALHDALDAPRVRAARRCGPIVVPNHKLIPDVRWIRDLPDGAVVARSDALRRPALRRRIARGGVQLIPVQRLAILRHALVTETDDPATMLPLAGYHRAAVTEFYAAYVRC